MSGTEKGTGFGSAHGTFGELLQGVLPEVPGQPRSRRFLVTLPLDAWSTVVFRPGPAPGPVRISPVDKVKSQTVATRMLRAFGYPGGGELRVFPGLPEGKGLASSSADLVATARAVADALGVRLDASATEDVLRGIEPTDGVMWPGIVSYHHREVRLRERLGVLPPLTIVAHDSGGTVDTVRFNEGAGTPSLAHRPDGDARSEYQALLDALAVAVRAADLAAVGEIATRSGDLHQRWRPDPRFATMKRLCAEAGGLGVVTAHSGTYLGIMLGEHPAADACRVRARLAAALPGGHTAVFTTLGPSGAAGPGPMPGPAAGLMAATGGPLRPNRIPRGPKSCGRGMSAQ